MRPLRPVLEMAIFCDLQTTENDLRKAENT